MGLLFEVIGLKSPRGRLLFFFIASVAIFFTPYFILAHLSLWKLIGFDSAPSIGLTRAYWQVMHLHLAAAWLRNPLIFPVMTVGLSILALDCYHLAQKYQHYRKKPRRTSAQLLGQAAIAS